MGFATFGIWVPFMMSFSTYLLSVFCPDYLKPLFDKQDLGHPYITSIDLFPLLSMGPIILLFNVFQYVNI